MSDDQDGHESVNVSSGTDHVVPDKRPLKRLCVVYVLLLLLFLDVSRLWLLFQLAHHITCRQNGFTRMATTLSLTSGRWVACCMR